MESAARKYCRILYRWYLSYKQSTLIAPFLPKPCPTTSGDLHTAIGDFVCFVIVEEEAKSTVKKKRLFKVAALSKISSGNVSLKSVVS